MISADAIHDGLVQGEFFLEYLPTVSLADGRCTGAEALTRWRRSSGVVQPDDFIPIIEGTHLSGMLTYWVFETVAKELGDWLRAHKELDISINVPPEIIGRGGMEYAAEKTGLSDIRNQIILEVTERGIPDSLGVATLESVPVRRPDCSRRCDLERDQPRHPVALHVRHDQDGPVARRPDHT